MKNYLKIEYQITNLLFSLSSNTFTDFMRKSNIHIMQAYCFKMAKYFFVFYHHALTPTKYPLLFLSISFKTESFM